MSVNRLRDLDSLRGLASVGVVIFHYYGHFSAIPCYLMFMPLCRSGYYLVDFFFCLSGFVLSMAYWRSSCPINTAVSVLMRVARLYPLHLATLLTVVLLQFCVQKSILGHPFIYSWNDGYHFMLNLGLVQSVGLQHGYSFNGPSWSISTEFWVNVVFFMLMALLGLWGDLSLIKNGVEG